MKKYIIAPSVLSANFYDLKSDIKLCQESGIEWIHYDVMDFDFVPNLTFGSKILKDITDNSDINIDIHFMVKVKTNPFEDFFVEYIKLKPKMMTMHIESMSKEETETFIEICNDNNIIPSLAISPKTKVDAVLPYLSEVGNILVMSVEPGFGGQSFMDVSLSKIEQLVKIRDTNNLDFIIEIDGGINEHTSRLAKKAGVDMLVAGSYLFGSEEFESRAKDLINND
ncbi:ribulose-phosphate 3-epimerase [[Acholeplasma] multilocale]|uniref:ribulose-phosphate 3-epimerase n=1 Tax=[Acholeplasma] multilocale TaxID=264638 RepID=UPI0004794C06|nr:ribulose-phosphate 3-epimerase [[Acholeplasma] multilocale]